MMSKAAQKVQQRRRQGGSAASSRRPQKSQSSISRKSQRPSSKGTFGTGARTQQARNVSAPASIGMVVPKSYFSMSGAAQTNTEYSGMRDSARVVGCDLFGTAVQAGSSTAAAGFGGTATYWRLLTPSFISTRLTNLEELFQYYAIRRLQIVYVPLAATSVSVNVALGVAQDGPVVSGDVSAPTQSQLLELDPSVLNPVWNVSSMTYIHTGTKTWATSSTGSGDIAEYAQTYIGAVLNGAVASTTYGSLWVEYVIDFYKPSPVLSSPSVSLERVARRLLSQGMSAQDVFDGLSASLPAAVKAASSLSLFYSHSHSITHTTTDCKEQKSEESDVVVVKEIPVSHVKRSGDQPTGSTRADVSDDTLPAVRPALTSTRGGYFTFSSSAASK